MRFQDFAPLLFEDPAGGTERLVIGGSRMVAAYSCGWGLVIVDICWILVGCYKNKVGACFYGAGLPDIDTPRCGLLSWMVYE